MKKYFLMTGWLITASCLWAQADKLCYPEPEFSNEVYLLNKDSTASAGRLEKVICKMQSKMKLGGFGGSESGYELEGEKSPVRVTRGTKFSFVYSTGASVKASTHLQDSIMRANGVDPSLMNERMSSYTDPNNTISLYKAETGKDKRKIMLQKNPGMTPFASKKQKTGDKYSFSVKKVREGYWELVIDKSLPVGEYAFTMMNMGSADGSISLFAFGVD